MDKKADIQQAFTDLIIQNGIRNVNMNDVFKAAKTGSGTFYNYYKSKDELIAELFKMYMDNLIDGIKVDYFENMDYQDIKPIMMQLFTNMINYFQNNRRNIMLLSIIAPEFKKNIFQSKDFLTHVQDGHQKWNWFTNLFLIGQKNHQLSQLDIRIMGSMVFGALLYIFVPLLVRDSEQSLEMLNTRYHYSSKTIEEIKNSLWNMIANNEQ